MGSIADQLPDAPKKAVFDVARAAAAALIDTSKKVKKPPTCVSIRQGFGKEIGICTLGNISVLSGKAKSRKTFLKSMLTASVISGDYIADSIRGMLPSGKMGVLDLDTEQSEYHAQASTKRTLKLAGVEDDPLFKPAMLRDYSTDQRKQIFEYYIKNTPEIGLVVIDGIRDLVESVNDEAECKKMVDWLMMLSTKYFCHIMVVIHENKVSNTIRGHLGTELQNKAETVISMEKVEGDQVSIVSARETRGIPFSPFAIYYNQDTGLPDIDHDYEIKPAKNKGGFTPAPKKNRLTDFTMSDHSSKLASIFSISERMRWKDVQANIIEQYPNIAKEDVRRNGKNFLLENGYLDTNAGEEKNSANQYYWLTEKTKKQKSPF